MLIEVQKKCKIEYFPDYLPIELHGTGGLDPQEPDLLRGLGGDPDDLEVKALPDRRHR